MTPAEIKAGLRARASQSVPWAGMALSGSGRGAAYAAAQSGKLGVPVYQSGGLLRVASVDIAAVLKIAIEDEVAAPTSAAAAAPVAALTAPKAAPAKSHKVAVSKAGAARKAPAAKAKAATRKAMPRQSKSLEAVG